MLAFACDNCNKQLKVKEELAGKKVKCPGCGHVLAVPVLTAVSPVPRLHSPGIGEERTVPPSVAPGAEERTVPPRNTGHVGTESLADVEGQTALGGGGKEQDTQALPAAAPDRNAFDFLAPAAKHDEIGRLGPYRVLKVLGAGGMGVVFRAEDLHLERTVALKAMLPSMASTPGAKERFFREARAAAALKHPHVVTIFQVGEDRGAPFLAMEFLDGESLDDRLKRETRLPAPEILRIGREIARGLAAAHEKGLIHRDIKPANLWLEASPGQSGESHVKILDFGLARAMGDTTHLTQSGAIIGTPAFMAPEQASGKPVDSRCDLFSLGCVLYCMCTGERPFKGNNTISILSALALEDPVPPVSLNTEVPTELSDLVMHLLAKKPDDRPESAKVVAETLQEIEGQTAETTARPGSKTRKVKASLERKQLKAAPTLLADRPEKKRSVLLWLLGGGLLGLGVLAAAIILLWQTPYGTVRIESVDPSHAIPSPQDGKVIVDAPPAEKKTSPPPKEFTNSLGMKFVWIPPGNFMMGSPKEEKKREKRWDGQKGPDETLHKVTLSKGFYMGVYTVTQEQWQEIMGSNPAKFKGEKNLPVEMVSWDDCQEFIKKLREKDKKPYRLPFEAEWEYACRAGTTTPFHFGETISTDQANYNGDYTYGTGKKGAFRQKTTPVGTFAANTFGLFDMHGNVLQWCQDWLSDYPQNDVVDPQGPEKGDVRVLRGGSWVEVPEVCRSAFRGWHGSGHRGDQIGFRLCFCLEEDSTPALKKDPPKKEEAAFPPKTFTNSIGMKFVWIPPGNFIMGSPKEESGRQPFGFDETQHKVTLTKGFYMGVYTVTQEQWQEVMANNPSSSRGEKNLPVEMVSWDDCQEFIKKLREKDKMPYRLPFEAEWEYACRAGTTTPFYFGETISPEQANYGDSKGKTTPVGSFPANAFGLHDMHGNVWQWCQDWAGDYPHRDVVDPQGPEKGNDRVFRGGSFVVQDSASFVRSAHRNKNMPTLRAPTIGVRLCFSIEEDGISPTKKDLLKKEEAAVPLPKVAK